MDQSVALLLAMVVGAWVSIFLTVTLPYLIGVIFYDSAEINNQTIPKSSNPQS